MNVDFTFGGGWQEVGGGNQGGEGGDAGLYCGWLGLGLGWRWWVKLGWAGVSNKLR